MQNVDGSTSISAACVLTRPTPARVTQLHAVLYLIFSVIFLYFCTATLPLSWVSARYRRILNRSLDLEPNFYYWSLSQCPRNWAALGALVALQYRYLKPHRAPSHELFPRDRIIRPPP